MDHVGIDLGRRQSHASILTSDGEVRHQRFATTCEALTRLLEGRRGRVLVEASALSEWVARHVESLGGWEVVVADPNFAPMYAERTRRVKTDRRDAEALMWACVKGNYRSAHRLSDAARALRATVKVRKSLVHMRAKATVQARALLAPHGISLGTGTPEGFPKRWRSAALEPHLREGLAPLSDLIDYLNGPIAEADDQLEQLVKHDMHVKRLATVPRVGPVTAATWIATLDQPDRFESGEQVVAYLGLAPREWSSSEVRLQGRITKLGPKELRNLLVECAWQLLTRPTPGAEPLRIWAQKIAERRGRRKAAIALARKLARLMFAIWRDGTTYSPSKLERPAMTGN